VSNGEHNRRLRVFPARQAVLLWNDVTLKITRLKLPLEFGRCGHGDKRHRSGE
jgi:hypothetical protein